MYNIPIECGIPMKLVRLIKMCLNETYSRVLIRRHLSDVFPIRNVFNTKRCFFAISFQIYCRVCH